MGGCIEMALVTFLWFGALAFLFSGEKVRARITGVQHYIERVTGAVLILLGLKVALSSRE